MCGIGGIFTLKKNSLDLVSSIKKMSRVLRHRGPDDEGFLIYDGVSVTQAFGEDTPADVRDFFSLKSLETVNSSASLAFLHRRLSILDLTPLGHQPMSSADEKLHIIFNGEIYNYIELKEELVALGHVFKGTGDTEVLIAAYKEWGEECQLRLNGMWAFVIYDEEKQTLFASRDRFGVKPFYYHHTPELFVFASEIKAIVALDAVKVSINERAVFDFFVHNEIEFFPQGMFSGIIELFPGRCLTLNLRNNSINERQYYTLRYNSSYAEFSQETFASYAEEIRELTETAVKLRLRSDVKVGSCLSGGLDSSAIAGIMLSHQEKNNSPEFFTAVFPGRDLDESKWAEEVIKKGGSWHRIEPSAEQLWKDLDDLIYGQDLPLWSSSTYAQFCVMRLAKENGVKVLLDGQGGDELFAGYVPYFLSYWNELEAAGKNRLLRQELSAFPYGGHGRLFRAKEKIKRILGADGRSLLNRRLKVLNKDFVREYEGKPVLQREYSTLNEHMQNEFVNTRLKLYLKCEDRCSMWHSVESRTPFSDDINLIERVYSIPGSYKLRGGILKFLMRESLKSYIPDAILSRKDKKGYLTPHNDWMRNLYPLISKEDFSAVETYLDKRQFRRRFESLYSPDGQKEDFLAFKILTFNRWRKLYKL